MDRRSACRAAAGAAALIVTAGVVAPSAAAATAYTIEPLNYNLVTTTPTLFGGAVCAAYECEKVPTAAALDLSHRRGVFGERGPIADGARTLNDRLTANPDEKLVFGFSQGAQIAGFWLRNYAPTSAVDPQNTSFLLVGDPENTYGVPWAPRVPTDTGFDVTELWAQYDGWADWPDRFDLLATANAVYGMFFVHPTAYDELDLAAEEAAGNVVTWQANGVTYKMVVDETLPILDPLRNIGLGFVADMVNDSWRAHIERQYDRPSTQEEADAMFGDPAETETDATEAAEQVARMSERQRAVRTAVKDEAEDEEVVKKQAVKKQAVKKQAKEDDDNDESRTANRRATTAESVDDEKSSDAKPDAESSDTDSQDTDSQDHDSQDDDSNDDD